VRSLAPERSEGPTYHASYFFFRAICDLFFAFGLCVFALRPFFALTRFRLAGRPRASAEAFLGLIGIGRPVSSVRRYAIEAAIFLRFSFLLERLGILAICQSLWASFKQTVLVLTLYPLPLAGEGEGGGNYSERIYLRSEICPIRK
jgi:hypothetical protein